MCTLTGIAFKPAARIRLVRLTSGYFLMPKMLFQDRANLLVSLQEPTSSAVSVSSSGSNHRALSIEPDASLGRSIFFEQSHPVYPLLDANLAKSDKQSRLLAVAIAIITKYTSPELKCLHNNVLIEELTASLLLEARSPSLETVEAAILFTQ